MNSGILVALIISIPVFAWMTEDAIFTQYGERAFRSDSTTLCIVTTGGDTLFFIDTEFDVYSDYFEVFHLIDVFPEQNYWVLHVYGYEWQEWQLVNGANGRIDVTISEPVLSPDGIRLLCMMDDIDACFIENGIQIWRIDEDSLALEFSDLDVPWGPVGSEWVNDSVIVFEKMNNDWENRELVFRPGRLELSNDGTWMPDDPADWEWQ